MSDVCLAYLGDGKLEILTLRKDLGRVVCGKEVSEFFELENDKSVPVCFSIVDEDPEDNSFGISPRRVQVPPRKTARFKVVFVSYVPDVVYEKKYSVSDGRDVIAEFTTRCTSIGPCIQPRQVTLKFFILRNVKIQTKRFELANGSTCPTKFHVERPGRIRPFRIAQESGEIHGGGKFIFDVKFVPTQFGVYRRKVYCLFRYHPPVLFELVGVYNPGFKIEPNKIHFHCNPEDDANDSYQSFMKNLNENYDTVDIDSCLEIVSARKAVVKFAEDQIDKDTSSDDDGDTEGSQKEDSAPEEIHRAVLSLYYVDVGNNPILTDQIRLINVSTSKEFYFEWSNENGKYFSATPKSGNLKEGEKVDLMIEFSPDLPQGLYSGELDLKIFPLNNDVPSDVITLPTTLNLSIIGELTDSGWLNHPQNLFTCT